jgi:hypothetical protein
MIKRLSWIFCLAAAISLTSISCSRGTGCPAETATGAIDKKGQLKTKPGKSSLFPKDTQKKLKQ